MRLPVKTLDSCLARVVTLCILAFVLTGARPAAAQENQCFDIFERQFSADEALILDKLSTVPHLRDQLKTIMDDPELPPNIKLILHIALIEKDVAVVDLTNALRAQLNLSKTTGAFYRKRGARYRFMETRKDPPPNAILPRMKQWLLNLIDTKAGGIPVDAGSLPPTRNEETGASINKALAAQGLAEATFQPSRHAVYAPDVLVHPVIGLWRLVHELAHVRFEVFLDTHLEEIAAKLPPHLVRIDADGTVYINRQFMDYMTERYAYQADYEFITSTYGKYISGSGYKYDKMGADYRNAISWDVIETYRITDPDVLVLAQYSLREIFSGWAFR